MSKLVNVRERGADDVRVGDVVWCGGWRKVIEVLPRGSQFVDSSPRFVFEDGVDNSPTFRGVLSEDIMLVRDATGKPRK